MCRAQLCTDAGPVDVTPLSPNYEVRLGAVFVVHLDITDLVYIRFEVSFRSQCRLKQSTTT
jgi:hypothetical protein